MIFCSFQIMVLILYMAMQKRVKWKSKTIITRYFGLPMYVHLDLATSYSYLIVVKLL